MDQLGLASRFDQQRPRLRAVAYRIVGSVSDAEDAVQEAWLRLQRAGCDGIEDLDAWLTTVVARICLNVIRDRRAHTGDALATLRPEPIVRTDDSADPQSEVLLADAVGIALQVVLDTLNPAERVAFVLHDMFAVPFGEIAELIERSPDATRQLASRARRRVQAAAPPPDSDLARQRQVVEAYFAAAREADLDALVAVLAPEVVVRSHTRRGTLELRGADRVARAASMGRQLATSVQPALINGIAGAVAYDAETPFAILAFTIAGGRAVTIDIFNDHELVPRLVRSGR